MNVSYIEMLFTKHTTHTNQTYLFFFATEAVPHYGGRVTE